ncbi:diacylglycerol/lipid kinase family protein [Paucisalibacillus globulus]|uniref:diacylglycerol/lipid kinase family protein n=1 Tax=Paucisalibacillus globulus TaxID=351095 RepID=UPI0003FEAAE0|nr:YegS/Rv2252/BmrU family lipid kinase [Paucisalibacillus globulus]
MFIFIVNPIAGNGRAFKIFRKIEKSKLYNKITSRHYLTEYPGHAEEIVKQIVLEKKSAIKAIIIIGGDGTVHEVINGMGDANIPISFIAGGSGNDFGRGCRIKGSPLTILKKIVMDKKGLPYWKGNYDIDQDNQRNFINSIGFGFDAEIAEQANQSSYKNILNTLRLGTLSYVIALIQVLFKFKPFQAEIVIDGNKQMIKDCWMVTIANHQYYGGGMKIIPTAKIQSRVLPVLIIHGISKWKILGLFITVFTGKHVMFKEVNIYEAETFSIKTNHTITLQVDGQTDSCYYCMIAKNSQDIQIKGSVFHY